MPSMEQRQQEAEKRLKELTSKVKAEAEGQEGEGGQEPAQPEPEVQAEPKKEAAPEPKAEDKDPVISVDYKEAYRRLQREAAERAKKEEQRYKTLQGKYQAEVVRVREELEKRDTAKPTPETEAAFKVLVDTIGDEEEALTLWNAINPKKEAATPADLAEESVEAPGLEPDSSEDSEGLTRDEFFSTLDTQLPGWDIVQESPEFVSWARDNVDPVTGVTLYSVISKADKANDPAPIVNILTAFVKWDDAEKQRRKAGRPPVDVDPEVVSAGGTGEPPKELKTFSRRAAAEWPKLYAKGSLTAEEYNTLLAEFSKALQEGRVTP